MMQIVGVLRMQRNPVTVAVLEVDRPSTLEVCKSRKQ